MPMGMQVCEYTYGHSKNLHQCAQHWTLHLIVTGAPLTMQPCKYVQRTLRFYKAMTHIDPCCCTMLTHRTCVLSSAKGSRMHTTVLTFYVVLDVQPCM